MITELEGGRRAAERTQPDDLVIELDEPVIVLDPPRPKRRLPGWARAALVLGAFAALVASCDAPGFDPRLVRHHRAEAGTG